MTDQAPPRIVIGSEKHKELFCRTFAETHEEYKPSSLPWPDLDEGSLARLRSLPIWSLALQAETNAGAMVHGFAKTIADPVIREAVALQGYEEERHGKMIATLVDRYGLNASSGPPALPATEPAFIHFGYRECLDSFIGFGAFRMARETQFMPPDLISLFSRVIREEARHIVFFINWVAYQRVHKGYGGPFVAAIATAIGYIRALFDMVGSGKQMAGGGDAGAPDMSALAGINVEAFLTAALAENQSQMAQFDPRLLRPRVVPGLGKTALDAIQSGRQLRDTFVARTAG